MDDGNKDTELRLLFETVIHDIRFCKKQQWYIVYLATIAFAGIISFTQKLPTPLTRNNSCLLILSSIAIGVLALYYLNNYYLDIIRYRKYKNVFLNEFSKEVKDILSKLNGKDIDDFNSIIVPFFLLLIGETIFAVSVILSKTPKF